MLIFRFIHLFIIDSRNISKKQRNKEERCTAIGPQTLADLMHMFELCEQRQLVYLHIPFVLFSKFSKKIKQSDYQYLWQFRIEYASAVDRVVVLFRWNAFAQISR